MQVVPFRDRLTQRDHGDEAPVEQETEGISERVEYLARRDERADACRRVF